jgi:hypothetical protein
MTAQEATVLVNFRNKNPNISGALKGTPDSNKEVARGRVLSLADEIANTKEEKNLSKRKRS